jgi:hypothetical protein
VVLNGNQSSWEEVLSGVPQGSVLGPLLFLIFINDLDVAAGRSVWLRKFADDSKMAKVIRNEADRQEMQNALDRLTEWARTWGMSFNISKCKVMHIGRANIGHTYYMEGKELGVTKEERDLGVVVTDKLKPAAQCAQAARTAQAVLGQITRAFQYRNRTTFMQLYKQYVRPHLEFSVQAWSPWSQADKDVLEKVQKRAVGMVSGLQGRDYEDRLRELGMTTLEERRHQADMSMMHKVMTSSKDEERVAWFTPPTEAAARTRRQADPLNVRENDGRLETRRNFFTVRVCQPWNAVPGDIKRRPTAASFKHAYSDFRKGMI